MMEGDWRKGLAEVVVTIFGVNSFINSFEVDLKKPLPQEHVPSFTTMLAGTASTVAVTSGDAFMVYSRERFYSTMGIHSYQIQNPVLPHSAEENLLKNGNTHQTDK